MTDGYLTSAQLAARLNVTPVTVRTWRQRGQGPDYIKVTPRCVRYALSDVERWERDHIIKTGE